MNFVEPSVELIDEKDIFKRIERAGRLCYKSESKITDESAFPFFQRMVKNGHTSVLEHSVIFVRTHTAEATMKLMQILNEYTQETGYPHYIRFSNWDEDSEPYDPIDTEADLGYHLGMCIGQEHLFSGNVRAWRKLCEKYSGEEILYDVFHEHKALKDIFENHNAKIGIHVGSGDEPTYTSEDIEIVDSIPTDPEIFKDAYKHNIVTLHIVADRGIIDEYTRHRACSFSVESTRYISYKNSGVTFVFPWWFSKMHDDPKYSSLAGMFGNKCYETEVAYQDFINKSKIPQLARGTLPLWVKSEMAMTGTIQQWIDVLKLRDSAAAHPDAQKIAKMIRKVLVEQVGVKELKVEEEDSNE